MATKSFLKEVEIKDSKLARQFVNALSETVDNAEDGKRPNPKSIELSRSCTEVTVDEIKDFFGVE